MKSGDYVWVDHFSLGGPRRAALVIDMPVVRPDVRIVHVPYNVVCENTLDVPRKRRRR